MITNILLCFNIIIAMAARFPNSEKEKKPQMHEGGIHHIACVQRWRLASKCAVGAWLKCPLDPDRVIIRVSCANYKLENARVDVDVINADPKDVCNTNFIASDDNTSYCYTGASWEVVPVKCVSCYIVTARPSMVPSKYYTEELTFDLAAGMKLRLEVSGNKAVFNHVWFVDSGMNEVYLLSLRWSYTVAQAVFNTKKGRTYGREKVVYGVSVNSISNYIIEVHISESDFMTYVDGTLLMTNQMRLPLTGVRRVTVGGFTALHSFHIGYVLC